MPENIYGYVRVSTKEQNEDRQLVALILLSGYMIQRTLKFLHSFENKRIGMAEK